MANIQWTLNKKQNGLDQYNYENSSTLPRIFTDTAVHLDNVNLLAKLRWDQIQYSLLSPVAAWYPAVDVVSILAAWYPAVDVVSILKEDLGIEAQQRAKNFHLLLRALYLKEY